MISKHEQNEQRTWEMLQVRKLIIDIKLPYKTQCTWRNCFVAKVANQLGLKSVCNQYETSVRTRTRLILDQLVSYIRIK